MATERPDPPAATAPRYCYSQCRNPWFNECADCWLDGNQALSSMSTPNPVKEIFRAGESREKCLLGQRAHKVAGVALDKMSATEGPGDAPTPPATTQEVDAPMPDKRTAASEALAAHDNLRSVHVVEPPSDEDGAPLDPEAWLKWHHSLNRPAYDRWHAAMDALDASLGRKVGRHPFTFRPICEEILRDAD